MKFTVTFLLLAVIGCNTPAQDYTQWGLPEGAKSRLGKGTINDITYSSDGTRLAVAGSIGIWLRYGDASRGRPAHRSYGSSRMRSVQPGWRATCEW